MAVLMMEGILERVPLHLRREQNRNSCRHMKAVGSSRGPEEISDSGCEAGYRRAVLLSNLSGGQVGNK
jgi:hypothetical protein